MNDFFDHLNKVNLLDRFYFWGWMFLAALLAIIWLWILFSAIRYSLRWLRKHFKSRNSR